MSYESEERYWTDYLRVALPVIGLLLMLALFWWWAQNFIGDEGGENDIASSTETAIATAIPLTATNTVEVTLAPGENASTPTEDTTGGTDDNQTPAGEPTQAADCGFSEGDMVVTTSDVNLRSDPEIPDDPAANVVVLLTEGTELQIVGSCFEENGDYEWWQVRNLETAEDGWVASDFFEPVDAS